MNMKALVTGATGFLGSHLVDRLLEKRWEVHVLVRQRSNLRWLLGKKVHYHQGDLVGDPRGLEEGLKGVDVCFHLAGVVAANRPSIYFEANAGGTSQVLESALRINPGIKRLVICSSLAAHGPSPDEQPAREEDDCHPITDYGRSKRDAELIAYRYMERLPIVLIRPPAIYGPRDTQVRHYFWMAQHGFLPLPPGGQHLLNIAYVQDIATGLILAAEKDRATGQVYFVGDRQNYDWEEVADTIARSLGRRSWKFRIPLPAAYLASGLSGLLGWLRGGRTPLFRANLKNFLVKNWSLDIRKAREELGYEPRYTLSQGVEETAAWYRENNWL